MPDRKEDPIASTQMFRAFVEDGSGEAGGATRYRVVLVTIALVVVLAVVGIAAWLAL